ncbi:putative FBD-associated F-box protein At5g22720 isoform X2 [Medicago truncatula]|uniref:putative FBD-associated F-box protein At5g22720 isoform X2 n=1 Tax=Medicago truncatula TaxID=3880 RepID=UPI0019689382|nr:putative FBD-associated F-box protein At5g22720 isoform X2 [Medicago truncatula]
MKNCEMLENELPDHIISCIFSKLALKDLVKTSALSKQWIHEWGLRMDLNFDLYTMFDYNTDQDLPQIVPLSQRFHYQSKFATSLDQFMLHYKGVIIRSIRVKFPLGNEHRDVIDRLISKGIAKGAKHIELLFSSKTTDTTISIMPYRFSLILLLENDSVTYLHLQNCLIDKPRDFSGLKNLRTLVLQQVIVKKTLLKTLCSNCNHLVDFTLDGCNITSKLVINNPSLLRLNIVNVGFYPRNLITIIASSLSSFEYSCLKEHVVHQMNIQAPMLSKFSFRGASFSKRIGLSGLTNVTTIKFDALLVDLSTNILPHLFSKCPQLEDVTLKNCLFTSSTQIFSSKLRQLIILDSVWVNNSPSEISIDALNLSSFEYTGYTTRIISFTAPMLSKVFWDTLERENRPHLFDPIASLPHIENLAMIVDTLQVKELAKVLVRFQNLRQLELHIEGACDPSMDYSWLLDIATASQHLQKLTLSEHSHMVGFKRQKSEYVGFSHNVLEYVEFCGCVCSINVIQLATHLLRSANSLKKMTFRSSDRVYLGGGRWTTFFNACGGHCWSGKNVYEMLKDEVNEQCQLIIL